MKDRNLTTTSYALGLGLCLLATPLLAAGTSDWDTNADKKLDKSEFTTRFDRVGVFKRWDINADGKLSQTEFKAGMSKHDRAFNARFGNDAYAKWDENRDNSISSTEFNDGLYAAYDKNRNKVIDEPELNDVGDGGLFDV